MKSIIVAAAAIVISLTSVSAVHAAPRGSDAEFTHMLDMIKAKQAISRKATMDFVMRARAVQTDPGRPEYGRGIKFVIMLEKIKASQAVARASIMKKILEARASSAVATLAKK